MDLPARYCLTRRDLEENGWSLTARLSSETLRLMGLIGHDLRAFQEVRSLCYETRDAITAAHSRLRDHRSSHGC